MWRLLPTLALLILSQCVSSSAHSSNAALHRADALRNALVLQLEATGITLNEIMCATALTGLPEFCRDDTAPLWANATAPNTTATIPQLLQALVGAVANDMSTAINCISAVADVAGGSGNVVETVLPDAKPWRLGSSSEPTYRGEVVSLTPAVHVPVYSQSDAVASSINADVNMLGGLASKMQEQYTNARVPMMAAAMTGATLYMPAPSRAPDVRLQPWFQGAALPSRNMIVIVDLWTQDTNAGVVRVLQVARELLQTFVSSLDRICLIMSDDTTATVPIELVPASDSVRASLLQLLAARGVRGDRALVPRAKSDLQAAFHALDSAANAKNTYNMVLLVSTDAGHNSMLRELPDIATLVLFNVQSSAQPNAAVQAVQCAPRVLSIPIVASAAAGPLSPAQLRSIAPAFAVTTAKALPKLGDFVMTCGRCSSSDTASRLSAFMEISAVVRSEQVGDFSAADVVLAARVDLSRFISSALEHVNSCGTSCSISLVITSGIHAARVLVTTTILPAGGPAAPSIFDIEGEIFMQAWPSVLAQPTGSINISGIFWQHELVGSYRGLTDVAAHHAAAGDTPPHAFTPRTTYREVHWAAVTPSQAAAAHRVVAIFTREIDTFNSSRNTSTPSAAAPPAAIDPLPSIPVCSRKFPPFVLGLCFDAPLVYNRIDLFAPAGVTYANGSSSQVPFFSLSPISFNSPEAFLPRDPASVNFRNVQSLVEAINTGSTPMPKSSALVANGLTLIAEAELKALSLLANLWPSRNVSRVTAAVNGSSHTAQLLASASVFAVAVRSAVSFEFPGQKLDGVAAARSEATHYSPAFASSLSNMNTLSLIWSHSSSSVVASVPLAFPTRHSTRLSPRSEMGVFAVAGLAIPTAVIDTVMLHAFPALCDGVKFLCWMIDERGFVLFARDFICSGAASGCAGQSFSSLRPRIASSLLSSGIFQMRTITTSSSVVQSLYRQRSLLESTVAVAASHDGTSASAEQQLEINVFTVKATSATVAVLSGKGMQPVMDATRAGFLDCGPAGILCMNLQPSPALPSPFYSPPATATHAFEPVILVPSYSAACDTSTPAWIWAVVGTCVFLFCVSLCGGPIILRMYRKRKAARLMFDSIELKMQSNQQSSQQERPVSKADAVPQFWTPVSSVESFCNTSYVAEEAVLGMQRRGAGKLVELEDEVVVTEQQLTFLEERIENFVLRLSGVEQLLQSWDAIHVKSNNVMMAAPAKMHKE